MATLLDQLLSIRPYIPSKQPEIYNRAYRYLVTKCYKRSRPRKVFRTHGETIGINPVYVMQYNPVVSSDHRVIAVGDEQGYLSIVKTRVEETKKNDRLDPSHELEQLEYVRRRSTAAVSIQSVEQEPDDPSPPIQPVVYTLAWNPTGNRILCGYGDGSMRIWDLGKEFPVCSFHVDSYSKSIKRVAWGDNDNIIVSCSRTNEICVHDNRNRNKLTNRINCDQLSSKLSDIAVIYPYVLSSSSNQKRVSLWDLRKSYKLYRKVNPVESFDLGSEGYTNMTFDPLIDDHIFALGSDSKVRSLNWRSGVVGPTYRVPDKVDYFTKIGVDCVANVLVSGTCGSGAYLFDLTEGKMKEDVDPFWELNTCRKWSTTKDETTGQEEAEPDIDKENDEGTRRSCCAVAMATRRTENDGFVQVATGGDDSFVTVWD